MRPFASFFLIATALTLVSPQALAQGDSTAADKLFEEARALMKRGDHAGACPKLAESQRLDPSEGTLFFLAECHEKTGKLVEALTALEELRERLPATHQNAGIVKERIAALEKRVPRLTIKLAEGAPSETKVLLDGQEVATDDIGTAMSLNAGEHEIEVTAPGHVPARHQVALEERDSVEREVGPGREAHVRGEQTRHGPGADAGASGSDSGNGSGTRTAGYIVGAVGVAGAAVGALAIGVAWSHCGFWRDDCEPGDREDAKSWQGPAVGLLVGGGVVAATGAVLVLTAKPDGSALWVAPTFGISRAACVFEGSW